MGRASLLAAPSFSEHCPLRSGSRIQNLDLPIRHKAGLQHFLPERGLEVDTLSFQELSAILKPYDRGMIRFLSKKNNILDI
jgi:hypothetical protein